MYTVSFLSKAVSFIQDIPETDRAKVIASIKMLETDFEIVRTKILHAPVRELIVKKYRIVFFIRSADIYIVSGFVKKSQKTPKREIEYALEIIKHFT